MIATDSLTATAVDRLLSQHLAAWNAADPATRWRHLLATWSDDGIYQDPGLALKGRAALHAHIGHRRACHPGTRLVVVGNVSYHDRALHLSWELVAQDGQVLLSGDDFATLGPDGRFQCLVVCFRPANERLSPWAVRSGWPG